MDKTRNKIFVGCLALLLVMVAGYALFSQNLNITGTATAKGDFSVTPTCQPGIDAKIKPIFDVSFPITEDSLVFSSDTGYYDDSCKVNGDVVTFNVKFKYPGASRMFTLKVKNTGNIDAIYDEDGEYEYCFDENEDGVFDKKYECSTSRSYYYLLLAFVEDKEGNLYFDPDNNNEPGIEKAYDSKTGALKPGATLYILISSYVDKNLTAKKNFLFESTLTSKITFKQPTTK